MNVEIEDDRRIRAVTWLLVALATAAAELALAEPGRPPGLSLGLAAVWCGLALSAHAWIGRRNTADRRAVAGLLVLAAAPFAFGMADVAAFGRGRPAELVLLAVLRNLGLGLAILARHPSAARMAALASLFLVLTASAAADEETAALAVVGAYAASGTAWLVLAYWRGLRLSAPTGPGRRFPWATLGLVLGGIGAAAGLTAVGPSRAATILAGLMPSSGGTDWEDPDARGGVNDGENEVKGSVKPESIGFTESETYLDTDRPSLYDAFNDMYGEPIKPKSRARMIALSNPNITEQKERPAENLRAGRQFAAVRQKPNRPMSRPGEREPRALVYVKGPTPLHLALAAYDRFDGREWQEQDISYRLCPLVLEDSGTPWFRMEPEPPAIHASSVAHEVKIGALDSSPLPAPAHLVRFRVGQVNRREFFGWAQEGIVRMTGRTVPGGTIVETESRTVDPRLLREIDFGREPKASDSTAEHLRQFAGDYRIDLRVEALARSWSEGKPRGWSQVETVVEALRRHAVLDRRATAPPECRDVVAHFLLDARRGPDYQFATAAAVLLRSLGYPTRLVSGLHAAPESYDPRTRHTPVRREDVHVWAEVRLPVGTWVGIEPTPGYEMMGPAPTWRERLLAFLGGVGRWTRAHALALSLTIVAGTALIRFRREALDGLETLAWRVSRGSDPRAFAVRTLRLLERRSVWAGCPRPPGLTPRRWYGPLAARLPDRASDLDDVLILAEWGLYAPPGRMAPSLGLPDADADPSETCLRAGRGWTVRRLRAARSLDKERRT